MGKGMAKTMESDADNKMKGSGKKGAKAESKEAETPQAKGSARGIPGILKGMKGGETKTPLGGFKKIGGMKSSRGEEGDGKGVKKVK
jgi:hypothetical protein